MGGSFVSRTTVILPPLHGLEFLRMMGVVCEALVIWIVILFLSPSPGSLAQEPRCGRPLGMQFDPQNPTRLYVVDAYHGILNLDTRSGKMETIVNTSLSPGNREPYFKLVNDLVVLGNGSIFFTDSSFKYQRNQVMNEVFEGGANGRLFHFNLVDKSLKVVVRGLHFPNGLCLSYDGEFLLVAETTRARILK